MTREGTTRVLPALGPARGLILPLADVIVAAIAIYLAFALRFDDLAATQLFGTWLPVALMPLVIRPVVNKAFGLYRHSWRHVSVPELVQLAIAAVLATFLMLLFAIALAPLGVAAASGFPRSFWFLEGVASLTMMGVLRLSPRLLADARMVRRVVDAHSRAILFGAGDAGRCPL